MIENARLQKAYEAPGSLHFQIVPTTSHASNVTMRPNMVVSNPQIHGPPPPLAINQLNQQQQQQQHITKHQINNQIRQQVLNGGTHSAEINANDTANGNAVIENMDDGHLSSNGSSCFRSTTTGPGNANNNDDNSVNGANKLNSNAAAPPLVLNLSQVSYSRILCLI